MVDSHLQLYDKSRQSKSEDLNLLASCPDKEFDDILVLASQLCKASVAAIVGVTNGVPWIKSAYGIEKEETLLNTAFWKPVLDKERILGIKDLQKLPNFHHFGRDFIFYAGVPLISEGEKAGVLYVADYKPGGLNDSQRVALEILSRQILTQIEYQRQRKQLLDVQEKLEERYKELEKFSSVVSHDIKSPLANIISLTELLQEENKDNFDEDTSKYLEFLVESSYSLRNYVDGILTFYRSEKILEKEKEDVDLQKMFKTIADLYQVSSNVEITYPLEGKLEKVNKAALSQIFMNLISNALKYNSKTFRRVDINFIPTEKYYEFEVKDNGNGIPTEDFDKIFDLFTTLKYNDRDGNPGSGIGLATVKKLLDHLGGSITVQSELQQGSNFKFKIKRL